MATDRFHDTMSASKLKLDFHPAFWDELSLIPLTVYSLRELDRRNDILRSGPNKASVPALIENLSRFARLGGPDHRHIRGV